MWPERRRWSAMSSRNIAFSPLLILTTYWASYFSAIVSFLWSVFLILIWTCSKWNRHGWRKRNKNFEKNRWSKHFKRSTIRWIYHNHHFWNKIPHFFVSWTHYVTFVHNANFQEDDEKPSSIHVRNFTRRMHFGEMKLAKIENTFCMKSTESTVERKRHETERTATENNT